MEMCFPKFKSLFDRSSWLKEGGINTVISGTEVEYVDRGRERRYAGDETLDGGNYYALEDPNCINPKANTLMSEMFAYSSITEKNLPTCIDSKYDSSLVNYYNLPPSLPDKDFLYLIVSSEILDRLGYELDNSQQKIIISYPISSKYYEIDNVIDLRIPKTAQWFTNHFVGLENHFEEENHNSSQLLRKQGTPERFVDLLPTLLNSTLGGGTPFLQGIGAWLRYHGVSGLVFPSARLDSGVSLELSWGFNYIHYINSPSIEWKHHFGKLAKWNTIKDLRALIYYYEKDHTWRTEGITKERERSHKQTMEKQKDLYEGSD